MVTTMRTRGLVQVAREAAVAAGDAGRERGPSQTLPALAVIHDAQGMSQFFLAAWGWPHGVDGCSLAGRDSRAAGSRMIVRRIPTGGPWFESHGLERRFWPVRTGRRDGTTADERTRTMTSAVAAKRLGPLTRSQTTTMMLSNVPIRCVCPKHAHQPSLPNGFTHNSDQPCPFESAGIPLALVGTCCWLGGYQAVRELRAFGYHHLVASMHKDMSCVEASGFARELRMAADRIERRYRKPELEYDDLWEFEDALATIRTAACWFEQVADLGFGVFAWY